MRSVWYLSLRDRGSGKVERKREKRGIGWIKGPPHAKKKKKKKAHVEMETDKVTQQGIPDGEGEPESVFVITVFTYPPSSFILYLFIKEWSVLFLSSSLLCTVLYYYMSLQPLVTEMQTSCEALLMLIFQLSLSSWSAIVPRSDLKSNVA